MTPKERAAMQQALNDLNGLIAQNGIGIPATSIELSALSTITALREALAEQAEQEPKYWTYMVNGTWRNIDSVEPPEDAYDEGSLEPLYAAPVRTKDLTDDEIESIMVEQGDLRTITFARAVIAADREKNK